MYLFRSVVCKLFDLLRLILRSNGVYYCLRFLTGAPLGTSRNNLDDWSFTEV